jgi:hypothetical protein
MLAFALHNIHNAIIQVTEGGGSTRPQKGRKP